MKTNVLHLSASDRQQLFLAAHRALESGLDYLQLVSLLPLPDEAKNTLSKRLQRGESFSSAAFKSGCINLREKQLIRVGELSGTSAAMLGYLEHVYGNWHQLYLALRSQLMYPFVVVGLALLILPLLSALKEPANGASSIAFSLATFAGWCIFARGVMRSLRMHQLSRWPDWLVRASEFRLREHLLGKMIERDFMLVFASLTQAGVDYMSALNKLGALLGGEYQKRCLQAAAQARIGGGVVNALRDSGLVLSPSDLQILRSAEQAGRFPDELKRLSELLSADIAREQAFWATWLGRISYFVVLALLARLILP